MKLLVAGDYCPQDRISAILESDDYSFMDSTKIVIEREKPDLAIVNFECAVDDTSTLEPIKKSGPNLRTNSNAVKALKYAGFNFATLANNHIMDYGVQGLDNVIDALNEFGLHYVGVGRDTVKAALSRQIKIGEETVSIINCCEHEFSVATPTAPGAYGLDPIDQFYRIREERTKSDYVIVIIHGGPEFYQYPTSRMVKTYRFFIDAGADIVINGHQHCFSGYERYKGKFVFYGLGNFCFDWPGRRNTTWNEGYLVGLDLNKDEIDFKILPYRQCDEKAGLTYLDEDLFKDRLDEINAVIADNAMLERKTEEYLAASYNTLIHVFEPQWRLFGALKRRGLIGFALNENKGLQFRDFIDCESHRDKLLYYLRNTFK